MGKRACRAVSDWAALPPELLLQVVTYLFPSAATVRRLGQVCRRWRGTMAAEHTWTALFRTWFGGGEGRSARHATQAAALQLAGKLRQAGLCAGLSPSLAPALAVGDAMAAVLHPRAPFAAVAAVWGWAAERGHVRVLERMLATPHLRQAGLLRARDARDRTALYLAARHGHLQALDMLLLAGADLEARLHDGTTPLLSAAHHGRTAVAARLIAAGADVRAPRKSGATPLYIAAQEGFVAIVSLLLDACAEVDTALKVGATPLYIAAQNGHAEAVALLLARGASPAVARGAGTTALHAACNEGHAAVVACLLAAGADKFRTRGAGGQDALCIAAYHGSRDVVALLLASGQPYAAPALATPLAVAAQKGHLRVVRQLVRAGALPSLAAPARGPALYIAARSGHAHVVAFLLRHGAEHGRGRFDGDTPLVVAARRGYLRVCRALVKAGADCNLSPSGEHPLLAAVAGGSLAVAELLLAHGARVDAVSAFERLPSYHIGDSPLHAACRRCDVPFVRLFLAHGASADAVQLSTGETPTAIARHLKATAVVKALAAASQSPAGATAPLQRLLRSLSSRGFSSSS